MHIAYCIPSLHLAAGMERVLTAKANYLVKEYGYKVSFITSRMKGRNPAFELEPTIKIYDLDIDYTSNNRYSPLIRIWKKYKMRNLHQHKMEKLLMSIKPDITVSTFIEEETFITKCKDGSKKIAEFHFCKGYKKILPHMFHYPWWAVLSNYYTSWVDEHIRMPRFERFVCLTSEDAKAWDGGSNRMRYIYNMFPWKSEKLSSLEEKVVIAIGRLDPQKGFDLLIPIWAKVSLSHPDWKLHIYGEGPERGTLESLIEKYSLKDKVVLMGNCKYMSNAYLSSSILVMTSRFEGLPMILVEAKMYGIPCVSYDFPCGPKDTIEDGVNGFIVPNGDSEMFSMKLARLIDDENLRKNMGMAQLNDLERFSPEMIMPQWKTLFEEVVKSY